MELKKILAFSSSRSGNSGFLEKAAPVIEEFLGNKPINIAFIPFADADKKYEEYACAVQSALKNPALHINVVLPSNAARIIENCEVIMVGGGNTFKLVHDLYELDLLDFIRAKIKRCTHYIGWSAGSNILAPSISTTNDMPIVEPRSFKALGLFPFQINPHYFNKRIEGFNGETRDDRLAEFLKMNPAVSVVGLPEGGYLKFENNLLQYFGEVEGVLFSSANNEAGFLKRQLNSEQDISFIF